MFKIVNGIVTFVPTSLYVSAEGDQSGGGGGSASLTEERVIALAAQQVSNQLLARTKDIEKRVGETVTKQLSEQFGSFTKSFEEKFAAIAPAGKGDKKGAAPAEGDTAIATMKRQLDELTKGIQDRDAKLQAADARARSITLRQRTADELAKYRIEGPRAKAAMAMLISEEGRVAYDDDGETLVFKDDTGTTITLEEGLKSWAKSESAQIFMAPTGARGSGDRPNAGRAAATGQSTEPTDDEMGTAILRGFGFPTG